MKITTHNPIMYCLAALYTLTAVAVVLQLILLLQKSKVVKSKECTNIPPQLSSHSYRAALLLGSENNSSWKGKWKQEQQQLYVLLKHLQYNYANSIHDLMHNLTPDDGEEENQAWSSFLPMSWAGQYKDAVSSHNRIEEYDWRVVYRNIKQGLKKFHAASNDYFLQEVSLHDVGLDPDSMHGRAQRTNLEYLLMLDVDRLVWSFRTTAGLPALGMPYGGWESSTSELRGHFVGHYLSATAKLWASTHNLTVQERMKSVVDALHQCQVAMATGYLSAFPSEFFDRFEAIKPVWAPYYTMHKIMNGLLDQYTYAGNELAFNMTLWMADYFYNRVQNVIQKFTIERHWYSLNEETGGMNDVLYRLYTLSGNQKHLVLAHLFDKPCFLGLLAVKTDSISGFHANTHIPIVIGAQMRYEVTGDSLYKDISTFFMDIVNSSHAYATGGTSVSEFWSDPKRLVDTLGRENEESCTTYNMLKVARNLFRWTRAMEFADYYERTLTNGVLSIQRGTDPGVMIYMLPQAPGVSKAHTYHGWGTKFDSFWCCYGTGVESFSKLGDSIYFLEESTSPSLYVIQFVSSTLNWAAAGLSLKQVVNLPSSWNANMQVTMQFSSNQTSQTGQENEALVNVRVPFWTRNAKALLNTEELALPTEGNFLPIKRGWKSGDKISLLLPVELRTEKISDDRPWTETIQAILFGPYLLAGMTDGEWDLIIAEKSSSLSDWITSIPEEFATQLFTFGQELKQESGDNTFVMAHSNGTVIMNRLPEEGTNEALQATFRVIDSTSDEKSGKPDSIKDYVGKNVDLELFNRPGVFVTHRGIDNNVGVSMRTDEGFHTDTSELDSKFKVLQGLDGNENSISFESVNFPNCYLVSQGGDGDAEAVVVQLRCKVTKRKVGLGLGFDAAAASFRATSGLATYHPMSFIVKGSNRQYLTAPLLTFRDETYTIYFNITTTASAH